MESEPVWLQYVMRIICPTPHFVDFSQDVLYRGADFSMTVGRSLLQWRRSAAFTLHFHLTRSAV